jgi:uncharacterized membrane protein YdfJ with MMPL/SSD domain
MGRIKKLLKSKVDGIGVVEIILILLVLILLVVIFKEQITKIINSVFGTINEQVEIINTK